jgi:hypothetical protein
LVSAEGVSGIVSHPIMFQRLRLDQTYAESVRDPDLLSTDQRF